MDQIISAAVAAIVSIIVVLLARRSETIKQFQSLRAAAYADFIRGVAGLAVMQQRDPQSGGEYLKGKEMMILVADAKSRIAIYGGGNVVASLAGFLRGGAVLDSPERAEKFTDVCRQMRNDRSTRPGRATNEDMHFLLFNLDPKDYLKEPSK